MALLIRETSSFSRRACLVSSLSQRSRSSSHALLQAVWKRSACGRNILPILLLKIVTVSDRFARLPCIARHQRRRFRSFLLERTRKNISASSGDLPGMVRTPLRRHGIGQPFSSASYGPCAENFMAGRSWCSFLDVFPI